MKEVYGLRAAAKFISWTTAERWISRGMTFITLAFLARVISPRDFGSVAFAISLLAGARVLREASVRALVQRQEIKESEYKSMASLTVMLGLFLTCITVLFAGSLAGVLADSPIESATILRVLAPIFLTSGLIAVPEARMFKALDFKGLAIRRLSGTTAGTVGAIICALAGFGVWSLVVSSLLTEVVSLVVVIHRMDPLERLHLRGVILNPSILLRGARDLHFGEFVGIELISVIGGNVDYVSIGAIAGSRAVGLYSIAYRITQVGTEAVNAVVGSVALPVFARIRHDRNRLQSAYLLSVETTLILLAPVFALFAVVSDDAIPMIFGQRWQGAAAPASWLSIAAIIAAISFYDRALVTITQGPRLELILSVEAVLLLAVGSIYGASIGIIAVAQAIFVANFLSVLTRVVVLHRLRLVNIVQILRTLRAPLMAALLAVAGALLVRNGVPVENSYRLAGSVVAGVVSTAMYLWFFERRGLLYRWEQLLPRQQGIVAASGALDNVSEP